MKDLAAMDNFRGSIPRIAAGHVGSVPGKTRNTAFPAAIRRSKNCTRPGDSVDFFVVAQSDSNSVARVAKHDFRSKPGGDVGDVRQVSWHEQFARHIRHKFVLAWPNFHYECQ